MIKNGVNPLKILQKRLNIFKILVLKMDEIKRIVKDNPNTIKAITNEINEVREQNYITKIKLIEDKIIENKIQEGMLKIAGEQMIDYIDIIEEKESIIDEYKILIGDEKVNQEIIEKGKNKSYDNDDPTKSRQKKRIISDLLKKSERLKQLL